MRIWRKLFSCFSEHLGSFKWLHIEKTVAGEHGGHDM